MFSNINKMGMVYVSKWRSYILMEKLNQVMLYVDDQTKAVEFWVDTMGFLVISEEELAEGI